MSDTMVASLPLPAGVPLDTASWEQTPLVVRQLILQLLAVIQQAVKPESCLCGQTECSD